MLPRDSQFSTTPFVFPLFPLYLSSCRPLSSHLQLSNRPRLSFLRHPRTTPFIPWSSYAATLSPHAHLKPPNASSSSFLRKRLTLSLSLAWENRWDGIERGRSLSIARFSSRPIRSRIAANEEIVIHEEGKERAKKEPCTV